MDVACRMHVPTSFPAHPRAHPLPPGHVPKLYLSDLRYNLWRQLRHEPGVTAFSATLGCTVGAFAACRQSPRQLAKRGTGYFTSFCHTECRPNGKSRDLTKASTCGASDQQSLEKNRRNFIRRCDACEGWMGSTPDGIHTGSDPHRCECNVSAAKAGVPSGSCAIRSIGRIQSDPSDGSNQIPWPRRIATQPHDPIVLSHPSHPYPSFHHVSHPTHLSSLHPPIPSHSNAASQFHRFPSKRGKSIPQMRRTILTIHGPLNMQTRESIIPTRLPTCDAIRGG